MIKLKNIKKKGIYTLLRFPLVILVSLIGSFALCRYILHAEALDILSSNSNWLKVSRLCFVILPYIFALSIFGQRIRNPIIDSGIQVFGTLLSLVVFQFLPDTWGVVENLNLVLLFTAGVCLSLFIVFVGKNEDQTYFWNYNFSLLNALLRSLVYFIFLIIGVFFIYYSFNRVFGLEADTKYFLVAAIFSTGVLFPWIFLSYVPFNVEKLEQSAHSLSDWLKLVSYLFFPILLVLGIMLYARMIWSVFSFEIPKNTISLIVSVFLLLGYFSFFLIFPLAKNELKKKLFLFRKVFFIICIPLIINMFIILFDKVKAFGMDETKYISLVFGLWMIFISFYFILSKKKNLMVMPMSLCFLIFVMVLFPRYNVYKFSKNSQIKRINRIIEQKTESNSEELNIQINNILHFFEERNYDEEYNKFKKYYSPELDSNTNNSKQL